MTRVRTIVSLAVASLLSFGCGATDEATTLGTRPSAPSPGLPTQATSPAQQPARWSKITREVERAYYALRPTVGSQIAFNVRNNRLLIDALRPCMDGRGFKIRDFELTHDPAAVRDVVNARNASGVDARWAIPPDPIGARNGLGLAGPLDPEYAIEVTDGEPLGSLDDAATAAYGEAYDSCLAELGTEPTSFDPTEMMDLLESFDAVGRETEAVAGFADIQAEYQACVKAAGFDFASPNGLLDRAKETYGRVPVDEAQAHERAIASTDAACREPLYDRFITLNTAGWQGWLDANSERIRRVEADLTRLALSD